MPEDRKTAPDEASRSHAPSARASKGATLLKWVTGATAVLSLIFGLYKLGGLISDFSGQRGQTSELIAAGRLHQQANDYAAAWNDFERAAALSGGATKVRDAQEELAMSWSENLDVGQDEKAAATANQLQAVLERGAVHAEGARKGDLLAHLGLIALLKRGSGNGGDPRAYVQEALRADAKNPYANALLGYLTLRGSRDDVAEAQRLFSIALASDRGHEFVREVQIRALVTTENDTELVRVANVMRKSGEPVEPDVRMRLNNIYCSRLRDGGAALAPLLAAVPSAEQEAMFTWAVHGVDHDDKQLVWEDFYRALLQGALGDRGAERATLQALRAKLPAAEGDWDFYSDLRGAVDDELQELSGHAH